MRMITSLAARAALSLTILVALAPSSPAADQAAFPGAVATLTGNTLQIERPDPTGKKEVLLTGVVLSEAVREVGKGRELIGRVWILSGSKDAQIIGQRNDQLVLKNGEKINGRVSTVAGGRIRIHAKEGADDFPAGSLVQVNSSAIRYFTGLLKAEDWKTIARVSAADLRSGQPDEQGLFALRPASWNGYGPISLSYFALSNSGVGSIVGEPPAASTRGDFDTEKEDATTALLPVASDEVLIEGRSMNAPPQLPTDWKVMSTAAGGASEYLSDLPMQKEPDPPSAVGDKTPPAPPATPRSYWSPVLEAWDK